LKESKRGPFYLEFGFLPPRFPLMLDIDERIGRDGSALAGDLNAASLPLLEAIGLAAQLGD